MKRFPLIGLIALIAGTAMVLTGPWSGDNEDGQGAATGNGDAKTPAPSRVAKDSDDGASPVPTKTDRQLKTGRKPIGNEKLDSLVRAAVEAELGAKKNPTEDAVAEARERFEDLLAALRTSALSKEQAVAARARLLELGASAELLKQFDYTWAANHPEDAVAHLDEIPAEEQGAYLENILPGLASQDPQAAVDLFEGVAKELRDQIRPRLLEGLVDHDPEVAMDYIVDDREKTEPEERSWKPMDQLAREMEQEQGLEATLKWADDLPQGALRANAWSAAYAVWAVKDPLAAVSSINTMGEGTDRDQAINGFISGHANQDPQRAVEWADQITNPTMREAALIRAGQKYHAQNPEGAAQWLDSSGLPEGKWGQVTGEE